jgi:parvulin-like peptidyl-prolyl isomerase
VKRDFGAAFTGELSALPVGTWEGPVASGLGLHLVRVVARMPASAPALDVVRAEVTREWENARREQALAESYRRLRAQYDVRVDAKLPAAGMPAS